MVKKPDMVGVVNVETVSQFQLSEHFCPKGTNLSSYIYPKALDTDIMDTPVNAHQILILGHK